MLTWPPDGLRPPPGRTSYGSSLREIAETLSTTDATPVPTGVQHDYVDRTLDRLRTADQDLTSAVAGAAESIRFNPRGHRQADQVQELADALTWLRRVSLQVQALVLGIDALYDRPSHQPRLDRQTLSDLLRRRGRTRPG